MKTVDSQVLPAPPSLMASLMAGFDAITNHIGLVLFPVVLDILLWLGPHLRLAKLIEGVINQMLGLPGFVTPDTTDFIQANTEFWKLAGQRLNFMAVLRSYPVGVPSLMASHQPVQAPFGSPSMLEMPSAGSVIGLWLLLTGVGLIAGTIYYEVVAQAALSGQVRWGQAVSRWPWASLQVLFLAIFWFALLVGVSIPGSCLISVVSLAGLTIGQFGLFLVAGVLLWLLFPLLFSAHGIFVNHRKMWSSVRDGIRLTRLTLPSTGLLFLAMVVLNEGLNLLWQVPADNSWFTLVGITGHGFVTTGLLAASFVYYRDADRWVQRLLQQAKLNSVK